MKIKKFKEFLKESRTSEKYARMIFREVFYGKRSLNYERQLEKYFPIKFDDVNSVYKIASKLNGGTALKYDYEEPDVEIYDNNLLLTILNKYFSSANNKDEMYEFIHNHRLMVKNFSNENDKTLYNEFHLTFETINI